MKRLAVLLVVLFALGGCLGGGKSWKGPMKFGADDDVVYVVYEF